MAAVRRALQNVILLLSTGTLVSGVPGEINSCNTTTHLTIDYQYPLFIHRLTVEESTTNTTRKHEIARTFLENCNAHIECTIPKMTDQCVTGAYGYILIYGPTLEIQSNSTKEIAGYSNYLTIMSTNYKNGSYQQAENVHCNYKVTDPGINLENISISIFEFAPFASSRDFCLNFEGYTDPIMCSGSELLYTRKTFPNKSRNQKEVQFSLTLPKTATIVPLVRYWISFGTSPDVNKNYQLKCTSKPVDFKVNGKVDVSTTVPPISVDFQVTEKSEVFSTDAPISVTVSIAILCVVITLCLVAALTISWHCVKYRSLKKQNKMAAGQPLEAVCNQNPMADNGGYQVPVRTADAPETEAYTQLSPEIGEHLYAEIY